LSKLAVLPTYTSRPS